MGVGWRIAVVHGPNLNMLGLREPERYGTTTLADIDDELASVAAEAGASLSSYQSNSEGDLVTHLQGLRDTADGVLINPAAYTHTSVAIRDALLAVALPTVEVHLTNTHAREEFRHHSTIADIVVGRVMGFGRLSYVLGLNGLLEHLGHSGGIRQGERG